MFFKNSSTIDIYNSLQKCLQNSSSVTFRVLNPDICNNCYAGEVIELNSSSYIYRGYKSWLNLAELLNCKMLTPKSLGDFVELTFVRIESSGFHDSSDSERDSVRDRDSVRIEKYGVDSEFFKISKMQEPNFIYYFIDALKRANIYDKESILNFGINRGDEFIEIKELLKDDFFSKRFVGIDYSKSAIELAKERLSYDNVELIAQDINKIDSLNLGRFDTFISIGTLQSSSLNYKQLLMKVVQEYLQKDSAIILGFPNCRWVGGEMVYGAKPPNYNFSEMGILYSDVVFAKKYLQQKKYRVTITGREYIFLTATKIKSAI